MRNTRWVPHVEHDLHTCLDQQRSPQVFCWVRVAKCFVYYSLSVCLFFSHGIVSLFSIYEFDCTSGIFRPSFKTMKSIRLGLTIWSKNNWLAWHPQMNLRIQIQNNWLDWIESVLSTYSSQRKYMGQKRIDLVDIHNSI